MNIVYFYFYVAEEDLHAVMVQRNNGDGTFAVRPVSAYYRKVTATNYINAVNARLEARTKGEHLPVVRTNPPVEYRQVPEWWTDRCPNWSHMDRVV